MESVLVVDDDDDYRELVALALHEHCRIEAVRGFGDAASALLHLASEPQASPALVLLDLHMPRVDGLDALRQLRSSGHAAPVAFLSSAASPEEQADCLAAGAMAFVVKPARYEDLVQRLVALIGDARAQAGTAPAGPTGSRSPSP
jgi:DNA-binding response OmpR family regulator